MNKEFLSAYDMLFPAPHGSREERNEAEAKLEKLEKALDKLNSQESWFQSLLAGE